MAAQTERPAPVKGRGPFDDVSGRGQSHLTTAGGSAQTTGIMPKNSREEIRVALSEYAGARFLHVRVYVLTTDGPKPTRQGVTVPLRNVGLSAEAVVAHAREIEP